MDEDARRALADEALETAVAEWITAHSDSGSVLVEGFVLYVVGSSADNLGENRRQVRRGIPKGQTWWTSFGLIEMLALDSRAEYGDAHISTD